MSALADRSLRVALETGVLTVDPLGEDAVQPASIDLRLGPRLLSPWGCLEEADFSTGALPRRYQEVSVEEAGWPLAPGTVALGATLERIALPSMMVGYLWGRSTLARLFVQVHAAGLLDPGYDGHPTLEIVNLGPHRVWLSAGDPIAQLVVHQLDGPAERLYGGSGLGSRYQGDTEPTPARCACGDAGGYRRGR